MDFKSYYDNLVFDPGEHLLNFQTAKVQDRNSRGVFMSIVSNGILTTSLSGLKMKLYYRRPDGVVGDIDAERQEGQFKLTYDSKMLSVPGEVECEIGLIGQNNERILSKTFNINVSPSLNDQVI